MMVSIPHSDDSSEPVVPVVPVVFCAPAPGIPNKRRAPSVKSADPTRLTATVFFTPMTQEEPYETTGFGRFLPFRKSVPNPEHVRRWLCRWLNNENESRETKYR